MVDKNAVPLITGRCYCGKMRFHASELPSTVAYCHCTDCRRATGAPVAAFAAFDSAAIAFLPDEGRAVSINPGVTRTFCETCGSPISGRYDYLPNKVYIAVGLLDQADAFPPEIHAHDANKLVWLHIDDGLERSVSSARSLLNK